MAEQIAIEKRFTEKEAAEIIGISQMTLIRKRNSRAIAFYRIGNRILYGESHLNAFLKSCEQSNLSTTLPDETNA
ncbi:MAG: helix-turn-helix domain-containing protein [Chloracidobacterium sp.]|nr:helix-turn-helix domain-containing protein [Chloracidobacterium sp.]